jgi:hypothetical protein
MGYLCTLQNKYITIFLFKQKIINIYVQLSENKAVSGHKVQGIFIKVCISTGNDNGMEGIVEQYFGKAPAYTTMDTNKKRLSYRKRDRSDEGHGIIS